MQSMNTLMLVLPGRAGDAEFNADGREQFLDRQLGIEDVGHIAGCRDLLEQAAAYRGLARTHFAGEQHEAAVAIHAIEQMRQRLLVALAHVEIARVRRDRERRFGEAKVTQVHGMSRSEVDAPLYTWRHAPRISPADAVLGSSRPMPCLVVLHR